MSIMPTLTRKQKVSSGVGLAIILFIAMICALFMNSAQQNSKEIEPTPIESQQVFHSVEDMARLFQNTPRQCTIFTKIDTPSNALQRAFCTDDTTLAIHTNREQAMISIYILAEISESVSVFAIGENWSVNCGNSRTCASQVKEILGGEIITLNT